MKKQNKILTTWLTLLLTGSIFAQPDLVVSYDHLDKFSVTVGELVRATWKTKNRGFSKSNSCRTSLWLSKDRYFDEGDIYLNSGGTTSLNPGQYDEDSRSFIIPLDIESGTYYVVFYADFAEDGTSVVVESNEENNTNSDILNIVNPYTDIKSETKTEQEFELQQNYPNPFNPSTVISFALPVTGNVTLTVYNMVGEKVADLLNSFLEAGSHSVQFNAHSLPSATYIYRLTVTSENGQIVTKSRRMLLMK